MKIIWPLLATVIFTLPECFGGDVGITLCSSDSFRCHSGECIKITDRCNGIKDCSDNSDEEHCDSCPEDLFRCDNTVCIAQQWLCDGTNDCGDLSDELHCDLAANLHLQEKNCSVGEFRCQDSGRCIPRTWVCDDQADCNDESDEKECSAAKCVGFLCGNLQCIPTNWRCDKRRDCDDGTDELDCDSAQVSDVGDDRCLRGHLDYLCDDQKTCISHQMVCDGIEQCPDGSDEGKTCTNQNCDSLGCASGCYQTPHNASCYCNAGYELEADNKSCKDIDECALQLDRCSQRCTNTDGNYTCSCVEGYTLQDMTKCHADGPEPILIFSTNTEIRTVHLRSGRYLPIQTGFTHIVGVDYDGDENRVYWSDVTNSIEAIMSSRLDGSNIQIVAEAGLQMPEDLAVDWIGRNLYFTDSGSKHVAVCSLHGDSCRALVTVRIDMPRAIVLDPLHGLLYWTDWGSVPQIGRAVMDGTQQVAFVNTSLMWPNGLTVDRVQQRLYWSDAKLRHIEAIDLDGNNRRVLLEDVVHHPFSMALFEDTLYWSDWTRQSLESCNKVTGKDHTTIKKESKAEIMGVHIYHPVLQPQGMNPCWGNPCSHLCLINLDRHFSCACPAGMHLTTDSRTCKDEEKGNFILVTYQNKVAKFHRDAIGKNVLTTVVTRPKPLGAVAYDAKLHAVLVFEMEASQIVLIHLNNQSYSILAEGHMESVEDFALDSIGGNLYWADSGRHAVEVVSLRGSHRMTLLETPLQNPVSIDVLPRKGVMFVALIGSHPTIEKMNMDGSDRTVLVSTERAMPVSLAADSASQRLYWSDSNSGSIMYVSFNGRARGVIKYNVGRPTSLLLLNSRIYWADLVVGDVLWTPKLPEREHFRIPLPKMVDMYSMIPKLTAMTAEMEGTNLCSENPSACSHICLPSPDGFKCSCPVGMTLSVDERTCRESKVCSEIEFQCSSGSCLPANWKCDGTADCSDGSDESNCSVSTCSEFSFRCLSGKCIPTGWKCDGHEDCSDGMDESDCIPLGCTKHEFRCGDGRCIFKSWVCDQETDCADGSDERNCGTVTCKSGDFQCPTGQCVLKNWVCDGEADCKDGADEVNCTLPRCEEHEYQCNNSRCVDALLVCNGNDECGDNSDELGCESPTCLPGMFQCVTSGKCVSIKNKCDGLDDCPDGEDEDGCYRTCFAGEFRCLDGSCIPMNWVCDKDNDCNDNSDETAPQCLAVKTTLSRTTAAPSTTPIPRCPHQFQCQSGQCIDLILVCDRQLNCDDMSDEGPDCVYSCASHNGGCSQICTRTPNGPICSCKDGYDSLDDGKSCFDINECEDPGHCSQFCINTDGGFKCACADGYQLGTDKRTCRAEGATPQLLLVFQEQILTYSLDGRHLDLIVQQMEQSKLKAVDFDVQTGSIYWADVGLGSIQRLTRQLTTEDVMTNLTVPMHVAIDWVSRNLYYCSAASDILVCSLAHPEDCATVVEVSHNRVTSLAVAPRLGYLFWTVWSTSQSHQGGRIVRSWLDGQDRQVIVSNKLVWPVGLVIDHVLDRIYWADAHINKIESAYFTGLDRRLVLKGASFPAALALFEDFVYWADWGSNSLQKCNKFNCHHPQEVLKLQTKIHAMRVVHDLLQTHVSNPCTSASCSHICTRTPRSYACLCPDTMKFDVGSDSQCASRATPSSLIPLTYPRAAAPRSPKPTKYPAAACDFCKNGGTCVIEQGNLTCRCADGFGMQDCSLKLVRKTATQSSTTVAVAIILTIIIIAIAALALVYYHKRSQGEPSFRDAWESLRKSKMVDRFSIVRFANPVYGRTTRPDDSDQRPILSSQDFSNPAFQPSLDPADMNYCTKNQKTEINLCSSEDLLDSYLSEQYATTDDTRQLLLGAHRNAL